MRIDRFKKSTVFYTEDRPLLKRVLYELGLVNNPKFIKRLGIVKERYILHKPITLEQLDYIESNLKKRSREEKEKGLNYAKELHDNFIAHQIKEYGAGKKKKFKLRDSQPQGS